MFLVLKIDRKILQLNGCTNIISIYDSIVIIVMVMNARARFLLSLLLSLVLQVQTSKWLPCFYLYSNSKTHSNRLIYPISESKHRTWVNRQISYVSMAYVEWMHALRTFLCCTCGGMIHDIRSVDIHYTITQWARKCRLSFFGTIWMHAPTVSTMIDTGFFL